MTDLILHRKKLSFKIAEMLGDLVNPYDVDEAAKVIESLIPLTNVEADAYLQEDLSDNTPAQQRPSILDPLRQALSATKEMRLKTVIEAATAAVLELKQYKASLPVCEAHKPTTGARSTCLICELIKLTYVLSRISYLCGDPNEMQTNSFDVDYNEDAVVQRVEKLKQAIIIADELGPKLIEEHAPAKLGGMFCECTLCKRYSEYWDVRNELKTK